MWNHFTAWLEDYLDHTSPVQLVGDTWKYLLAIILIIVAIKYVRRWQRRQQ